MKRIFNIFLVFSVFNVCSALAAPADGTYSIQSDYFGYGYIGLGANHDSDIELFYVCSYDTPSDEGKWEIAYQSQAGGYTIKNSKTGQYLSFCNTYMSTCKYLTLADSYTGSDQLWVFVEDSYSSGIYSIQSFSNPDYFFNLRTGTMLVGCYAGSFRSSNEMFSLVSQTSGGGEEEDDPSAPFKTTKIVDGKFSDNASWYKIRIRSSKFWQATDNGICLDNQVYADDELSDDYLWCFVKQDEGYRIYNRAYGTTKYLASNSCDDGEYCYMGTAQDYTYTTFYTVENYACDGYNFYSGNSVSCLNDHSGQGWLRYWNSFQSYFDDGSACTFYLTDVSEKIPVDSIVVTTPVPVYLEQDGSIQIETQVFPADASNTTLVWKSSAESVATVSSTGLVTAVAEGTTTITVSAKSDADVSTSFEVIVRGQVTPEPMSDPMLFVHFIDGRIYAFPQTYISDYALTGNTLDINTTWDVKYSYSNVQFADSARIDLPKFTSYKFNNKFNDQLYTDVDAKIDEAGSPVSAIKLKVAQIGKRLTASFKADWDNAEVYIGTTRQYSKVTRQRFDSAKRYIVSASNLRMVVHEDGVNALTLVPFGREVDVTVTFATDKAKAVPIINITTEDGKAITSKTEYKTAYFGIQGNGVFPDMEPVEMQIKGRGNTSWNWAKKPYRLKFPAKVKPFGMTAGKNWNLLSNHLSNSMMTNAIGLKVADMVQTAGANHIIPVDLYLNGEYKGSYNFTEKIGFSNNSLDIEDESCAALLELDSYYDETYKFHSDYYYLPVNIKSPDFSDTEDVISITQQQIQDDFNRLDDKLAYGESDYDKLVDLDMMARFFLVNELVLNRELKHPKSTYLYSEDVSNINYDDASEIDYDETPWIWGPIWDLDWAYGYENSSTYCRRDATMDYFNNGLGSCTSYWQALRYDNDEFKRIYFLHWKDFMENHLDELIEYIQEYYEYAQPSFASNYDTWHVGSRDYAQNAEYAKSWLRERAEYIYNNCIDHYDIPEPDPDPVPLYGDANDDGIITVSDINAVQQYLVDNTPSDFNPTLADANQDSLITISDMVQITNLIASTPATLRSNFSLSAKSLTSHRLSLPSADASLRLSTPTSNLPTLTYGLTLTILEGDYTGLQFDLTLPAGITLTDVVCPFGKVYIKTLTSNLSSPTSKYRLVITSSTPFSIGTNTLRLNLNNETCNLNSALCTSNAKVTISNSILSTSSCQDECLNATSAAISLGEADCIETATPSQPALDGPAYDLTGRKVSIASIETMTSITPRVVIQNGRKLLVK